jgi:formiminotetrahydrofolate cyclodeaminase
MTPYLDHPLRRFLEMIAAREPAPGGGSVTAVTASLAAALAAMAARYSAQHVQSSEQLATDAERLARRAAALADADAHAYERVLATSRATRGLAPDRRREQLRPALVAAASVPLEVAEIGAETARLAARLVVEGSPHVRGDAASAVILAEAAARSAAQLVRINVASGGCDEDLVRRARQHAEVAADAVRRAEASAPHGS